MNPNNGRSPGNGRRRLKDFLRQLRVLTPGALVRWNTIAAIIEILLGKLKVGMIYNRTFARPWELKDYEIKPGSALTIIRRLVKLNILEPLDRKVEPPEVQLSKNGLLKLNEELEIWHEVFRLTNGFLLERPMLQVLGERLDELQRLIEGTEESQS